jgi:hypothetical protein
MATRIIRDGILTSERINTLSPHAELFYRRLMSVADDHGRYSANLTQLRAYCYPLKLDSVKEDSISKHLAECVVAKLIVLYTVEAKSYLQMVDFGQRINGKSKYPEPSPVISGDSPVIPGVSRLDVDVDVDVDDKRRAPVGANLFSGISPQIVTDFQALRGRKKAPITPTAVAGIKREAAKAGLTLESALAICCERGWTGFKAEWVTASGPAPKTRQPL